MVLGLLCDMDTTSKSTAFQTVTYWHRSFGLAVNLEEPLEQTAEAKQAPQQMELAQIQTVT